MFVDGVVHKELPSLSRFIRNVKELFNEPSILCKENEMKQFKKNCNI
jgi:hypothetical protein